MALSQHQSNPQGEKMKDDKQIAVSLNFDDVFYRHMDRMSETIGRITESGQPTNFFYQAEFLKMLIKNYAPEKEFKVTEKKIDNLKKKKMSSDEMKTELEKILVSKSLQVLEQVLGVSLDIGFLPGFKLPEKTYGENIEK